MKTTHKHPFIAFLFIAASLLIQACSPTIVGQSGRTLGQGGNEFSIHGNVPFRPIYGTSEWVPLPEVQVKYQRGLSDGFDIAIGANSAAGLLLESKFQIVGNQSGKFATSLGLNANFGNMVGVMVPLYLSYHPSEDFAVYGASRLQVTLKDAEGPLIGEVQPFGEQPLSLMNALGLEVRLSNRTRMTLEGTLGAENVSRSDIFPQVGGGFGFRVLLGEKSRRETH